MTYGGCWGFVSFRRGTRNSAVSVKWRGRGKTNEMGLGRGCKQQLKLVARGSDLTDCFWVCKMIFFKSSESAAEDVNWLETTIPSSGVLHPWMLPLWLCNYDVRWTLFKLKFTNIVIEKEWNVSNLPAGRGLHWKKFICELLILARVVELADWKWPGFWFLLLFLFFVQILLPSKNTAECC